MKVIIKVIMARMKVIIPLRRRPTKVIMPIKVIIPSKVIMALSAHPP